MRPFKVICSVLLATPWVGGREGRKCLERYRSRRVDFPGPSRAWTPVGMVREERRGGGECVEESDS